MLERDRFTVYLALPDTVDQETVEKTAVITHQDMLRGEAALLGAPGVTLNQALALTTAWCWASLMRQGDYAGAWQTFRDQDCQGIEPDGKVDVDPTQPATPEQSP